MFGDNQSQKELKEKWPSMSYDEKVDTFLQKMCWYHSHKHIPGAPPHEAVNKLADRLDEVSKKSDRLTRSIRNATWVAAIIGGLGVIVAIVSLF